MASCAVTEQLTVKDDEEKKKKNLTRGFCFLSRTAKAYTDFWRELRGINVRLDPLDDTNSGSSGVLVTAKL